MSVTAEECDKKIGTQAASRSGLNHNILRAKTREHHLGQGLRLRFVSSPRSTPVLRAVSSPTTALEVPPCHKSDNAESPVACSPQLPVHLEQTPRATSCGRVPRQPQRGRWRERHAVGCGLPRSVLLWSLQPCFSLHSYVVVLMGYSEPLNRVSPSGPLSLRLLQAPRGLFKGTQTKTGT